MREERCPAPAEEGARNYATVLRYENRQPLAVFKVRLCGCTMVLGERFAEVVRGAADDVGELESLIERELRDAVQFVLEGFGRASEAVGDALSGDSVACQVRADALSDVGAARCHSSPPSLSALSTIPMILNALSKSTENFGYAKIA